MAKFDTSPWKLNDPAITEYDEKGFWISPKLFSDEEIDQMRSALMHIVRGERDFDSMHWQGPPPPFDPNDKKIIQITYAWWVNAKIRQLVRHPGIGHIASQLMRTRGATMMQDQELYKPGLGPDGADAVEGNVGWHQDAPHLALFNNAHVFTTAWIALQDTDAANGGMRFIVGSHKWGFDKDADTFTTPNLDALRKQFTHDKRQWTEHQCVLKAGQVSFHSGLTFHGSGANLTHEPRLSIVMNMMPWSTTFNGQGRQNTIGSLMGPLARTGDVCGEPMFPTMWPPEARWRRD